MGGTWQFYKKDTWQSGRDVCKWGRDAEGEWKGHVKSIKRTPDNWEGTSANGEGTRQFYKKDTWKLGKDTSGPRRTRKRDKTQGRSPGYPIRSHGTQNKDAKWPKGHKKGTKPRPLALVLTNIFASVCLRFWATLNSALGLGYGFQALRSTTLTLCPFLFAML